MSLVADRRAPEPASPQVSVPEPVDERREYGAALTALADLTASIAGGAELPDALRRVASRACAVLGIAHCSAYVRDGTREVFLGCAAHPGAELEDAVRRLVLGGPTDRITREIVDTRAPVLIHDAQSDPRALTSAVRAWKLRSILGVPIVVDDDVLGVLMFDNATRPYRYTPVDIAVASAFAAIAGSMLRLAREIGDLQAALGTATRQNKLLRRSAIAEHRLSETVLAGGGLSAIVELASTLAGKPAALYDIDGQSVARSAPGEAEMNVTLLEDAPCEPWLRTVLEEIVPGASATIEPRAGTEVRRRHLAAPVDVRGDRWGWVVIMEHPSRLATFDELLIRRAATHLALELSARRQMASSRAEARGILARQLVRGATVDGDLRRSAEYLGVSLDAPRIVAYLDVGQDPTDCTELAERVSALVDAEVLATRSSDGLAMLVTVPGSETAAAAVCRVRQGLQIALGELSGSGLKAGVSAVCRSAADIPGGFRVARQVARCIENFPSGAGHRVLTADDLGPGRLFVANGHPEEIRRFVDDVLGQLLQDPGASADLVRTLEAFYDTGRSVRMASEAIGVHENTVRYRLARIHGITGLDVAGDADDQLSVQIALLVLRLQGHPALRCFDAPSQ